MKARALVSILILVLAVLIVVGSCATMKSPDRMTYERFCGTWANAYYEPKAGVGIIYAKIIYNPDGTYVAYGLLNQTGPAGVGTYNIEERWTDSEGNSWYHAIMHLIYYDVPQYELWKINKYNAVFERQLSNIDYPSKIDPKDKHTEYRIYYRY